MSNEEWIEGTIKGGRFGPGPTEEEVESMGERIRNQDPLNRGIWETSDFKMGMDRGVSMARRFYIDLIQAEIDDVSNPMMVDEEFLDGLNRALDIIKEH